MPLQGGSSKAAISRNISTLMHEGYKQKQSVAIAYSKAGKSRKKRKRSPGNYSMDAIHYAMGGK